MKEKTLEYIEKLNDRINNLEVMNVKLISENTDYYKKLVKLRTKMLEMKNDLINSIKDLEYINEYKKEDYPPALYMKEGQVDLLNYLIDHVLEVIND